MYKALVKCHKCDFEGIRDIYEKLDTKDKIWVCPNCKKRYTNEGTIKPI